ncbi:hypothetical protein BJ508DRAFT_160375 [Ascobolus immersus RN42]|uniref:Uncharacterized protein n=1 Tax=Ascobolus immersus RN42 TaxID=1160509 RepID=A0A3N4HY63_ASCIM|nr:hypothetical protein BJ508DRAFT_160375 [Ascobolus immersus RN42]
MKTFYLLAQLLTIAIVLPSSAAQLILYRRCECRDPHNGLTATCCNEPGVYGSCLPSMPNVVTFSGGRKQCVAPAGLVCLNSYEFQECCKRLGFVTMICSRT